MARYLELSHPIRDGMLTYPGLPAARISDHLSHQDSLGRYAEGTCFQIGKLEMVANTGTYLDAPYHRYPQGVDVAGIRLEQVVDLPGVLIDVRTHPPGLDANLVQGLPLKGRAVLFCSGWDRHFGSPAYANNHPYLTQACAEVLVESGAALVGIDSINIDNTQGNARPVHSALLAEDIPIVEHLTGLSGLVGSDFKFSALPLPVVGLGSSPVRAFARVDD